MDTHEQFLHTFYLAQGSPLMSYGQNLDLRREGINLSFSYSSWKQTRKELEECEPGEHAEKLKARLERLEKDYMLERRNINNMVCAAVQAHYRKQENQERPCEKTQKPSKED